MSAYDMTISDAIYGAADRYVTRQRLHSMLEHEYTLLEERSRISAAPNTRFFFVFADTVKARGYKHQTDESNGWLGVRFRPSRSAAIRCHYSRAHAGQRKRPAAGGARGNGVNIIYAALYLYQDPGRSSIR